MKIKHNTRGWNPQRVDPAWAERVEREAERITDATEARYLKNQERIARVEARIKKEKSKPKPNKKLIKRLIADVDARRQELLAIHRQMTKTSASSQNLGTKSHRGIGDGGII